MARGPSLIPGPITFKPPRTLLNQRPGTKHSLVFAPRVREQKVELKDARSKQKEAELRAQMVAEAMSAPLPGIKTVKKKERVLKEVSSPETLAKTVPTQWTPQVAALFATQYKPKKVWPPDFSKLSDKEQFRFERRYKRRVKLATARPRWDRYVKLAQLFSVSFVAVYTVFWMDWKTENPPFEGVRKVFKDAFASFSPDDRRQRRISGDS